MPTDNSADFAHLHTHSEYSLLDGMSMIGALVTRAKNLGQSALAITDHGNLYGALKLYEAARSQGIKPIIGLEAYVAKESRHKRGATERAPFHLTLLAENERGYRNLVQLSTSSHLEGHYYKPRIDRELLERHAEGLIVLSGCPSGELIMALREERSADAREVLGWYRELFGERYFVELQEHGQEEFSVYNAPLVELAREFEIPYVLTNDSHYTLPGQEHAHDLLLCIGTNTTILDPNRMRFDSDAFYLRSGAEMRSLLPELPEASDETLRIAERVDIELDFGRTLLPDPGTPEGETAIGWLRRLCDEGLTRRYSSTGNGERERLDYELEVIEETGFAEYILIVRDIAGFAREQGIPMGVRGSAAASIVLYCLDVTDIEPLQYRLVFERFLNPERREMPDVDFDFADDRREEVIRYVARRYGRDHVAQIVTFGTLGAKAAIRDTGRALAMPYGDVDRVARLVPGYPGVTIDRALDESSEMRQLSGESTEVATLLDNARELEGVSRHASTHAAGIVISRDPLGATVPLQRATSKSESESDGDGEDGEDGSLPTTQYDMNDVARIGLLKLDFLGLSNLAILGRACGLVSERRGEPFDEGLIPDEDESTALLLAEARTFGVFQLEGGGMSGWVAELQPRNIRELAAMIALYRPGPMEHIPNYIDARHGRIDVEYPHEALAGVLDETFGVITYQDQVLEIARTFAGYSLGQADVMRKAMGKKIAAVMIAERERFVEGAVGNGYERVLAEHIFGLIEPFAGYAFNKAHAFSYATISWRTAWLKAHYPVEFMTAVLQCAAHDRYARALAECGQLDIEVLAPDINESAANFSIERSAPAGEEPERESIRFGMAQVKNVGAGVVAELLAERASGGAFESIEDVARRIPRSCNKRMAECLAKAGALDTLAGGRENRGSVVGGIGRIMTVAQEAQMQRETGQTSMFDLLGAGEVTPLPGLEIEHIETPSLEVLGWERELLGACVSDHPFREASLVLGQYVTHAAADIDRSLVGGEAVIGGAVTALRKLTTKRGAEFAAVTVEDLTGPAEITIWPDAWEQSRDACEVGAVLLAKIEVRERGERLTLSAERIVPFDGVRGELAGPPPAAPRQAPRAPGIPSGQYRSGAKRESDASESSAPRNGARRTEPEEPVPEEPVPETEQPDHGAGAGAEFPAALTTPETNAGAEEESRAAVTDGSSPLPHSVDDEASLSMERSLPTLPHPPRPNGLADAREIPELPALPTLGALESLESLARNKPERDAEIALCIEVDETGDEDEDLAVVAALFDLLSAHPGEGTVLLDVLAGDGRKERFRLSPAEISAELAGDLETLGAKRAFIERC